ncbi:response regulator [Muricoccus vinaceus]|uniref:Response regulator n=1 Tax=Muricoccus vinaceus TaxID=424704 RepID=A0ABV6IP83_9PROT
MSQRVLIVEDEILIALDLAAVLEGMGFEVVGTAADAAAALAAAQDGVDIALVDVNLRDGPTGPALGETLAKEWGATVIYLTANPRQVAPGISGPVGILPKPFTDAALDGTVRFAVSLREGRATRPPAALCLLGSAAAALQRACRQPGL